MGSKGRGWGITKKVTRVRLLILLEVSLFIPAPLWQLATGSVIDTRAPGGLRVFARVTVSYRVCAKLHLSLQCVGCIPFAFPACDATSTSAVSLCCVAPFVQPWTALSSSALRRASTKPASPLSGTAGEVVLAGLTRWPVGAERCCANWGTRGRVDKTSRSYQNVPPRATGRKVANSPSTGWLSVALRPQKQ